MGFVYNGTPEGTRTPNIQNRKRKSRMLQVVLSGCQMLWSTIQQSLYPLCHKGLIKLYYEKTDKSRIYKSVYLKLIFRKFTGHLRDI